MLAELYAEALLKNKAKPANYAELWHEWLWGTDCIAPVEEACGDMNQMHMLGLLLSFFEALDDTPQMTISGLLPSVPLVHLYRKPVAAYTLRELTTQVECLQLSWGCVLSHSELPNVNRALKGLMGRLGSIAQHAFSESDSVLDDQQYITTIPDEHFIVTRKYLRQMICVFFILFRSVSVRFGTDAALRAQRAGPSKSSRGCRWRQ